MILIIDNYDSFTYNLVQSIGELGRHVKVVRNDALALQDVSRLNPSHIIISPGPCTPDQSGISTDVILELGSEIPLLGVCLGHECIGQAFGGTVIRAPRPVHGKTSQIRHDGKTIFTDLTNPFEATRYHSLIIDRATLPKCLEITAETGNVIMGIRHREYNIEGVQFHPESFLTSEGSKLLKNFIEHRLVIS